MGKKRTTHTAAFKAKVALAAQKQEKTISQLAAQFNVHPTAVAKWKARLLEQAADVFVDGKSKENIRRSHRRTTVSKNRSTRRRE